MKPFYSIQELADILGQNIYTVADGLFAAGVKMTHRGKEADLTRWENPVIDYGNGNFVVVTGRAIIPDPNTVIALTDSLPASWTKNIEASLEESDEPATTPTAGAQEKSKDNRPNTRQTKEIAEAFPPPKNITEDNWKKTLSDPPKWLKDARISAGAAGVSALWNPAMFALCMVSKGHLGQGAARSIIIRNFSDWADEWGSVSEHISEDL